MKQQHLRAIALIMIGLILFLPISIVEALQITHEPNPAKDVAAKTATIEWATDVEATSRVDYGTSKQLGLQKTIGDYDTYHAILLENLTQNARYYFQLMSITSLGIYEVDNNRGQFYSFVTKTEGDIIAPGISNVSLISLTATTATIQWTTDEPSDSTIYFGIQEEGITESRSFPGSTTIHILTIPAEEGKTYDYIVSSCDKAKNCRNSTKQFFVGGADLEPPEIETNIPEWHHSGRLDIEGTTEPFSEVDLYLEGDAIRRLNPSQTGEEGKIFFRNVALPASVNNLTIEARDQVGNEASKDYRVKIDPNPPVLGVAGLPVVTNIQAATLTINISEPCTLYFDIRLVDETPPAKVTGLNAKTVAADFVDLEWDANNESDFSEYGVYRLIDEPGAEWTRIIATTTNSYQDTEVEGGMSYTYKVSAVDNPCNEGPFSDTVKVDIEEGGAASAKTLEQVGFSCEEIESKTFDGGAFPHQINLEEGINRVEITAVDRAGHQVIYRNQSIYDSNPPEFIETNLEELSPTYVPIIPITGRVSEQASVIVFINDLAAATTETDENGKFSVDVELSRGRAATGAERASFLAHASLASLIPGVDDAYITGIPLWMNSVKLVATDLTGSTNTVLVEQPVIYTTCGFGSWFRVDIGGHPTSVFGEGGLTPSALNPRMMLEGTEMISFPFNLSYVGSGNASIMGVSVRKYLPHESMNEDYDEEWVSDPSLMCNPQKTTCLVQMSVRVPDPTPPGENWTMFDKEKNISLNRKEECLFTGTGCLKVPMMLEISFKQIGERATPIGAPQQYPGQPQVGSLVQKQCWDLEISMDQRVNFADLPLVEGLLAGASGFLNQSIRFIDEIYEPLNQLRTYLFYGCALTWVLQFTTNANYNYQCRSAEGAPKTGASVAQVGAEVVGAVAQASAQFDVEIAKAGLCAEKYGTGVTGGAAPTTGATADPSQACKDCQDAVAAKMNRDRSMKGLCDRLWCPSAPTLQKYVKDAVKSPPKKITAMPEHYSGSSCACDLTKGGTGETCVPAARGNISTGYETMKRVYEWYKQEQEKEKEYSDEEKGRLGCRGPHTAKPKCCGVEYMNEWGTACGLGEEEMFSEIFESLCLSAQNKKNAAIVEGLTLSPGQEPEDMECHQTFNAVAGFCESSGNASVQPTPLGPMSNPQTRTPKPEESDTRLFACMTPGAGEEMRYSVKLCYQTTIAVVTGKGTGDMIPFRKDMNFYSPPNWDVSAAFANIGDEQAESKGREDFCRTLKKGMVVTGDAHRGICKEKYDLIKETIGDPQKDYVVDPTSSLIRTLQCACISGLLSYLQLWRKVFTALLKCFDTIATTGDGSPGMCQAAVSIYICDLIYELISCVSNKYSKGQGRTAGASFGDFFGALSNAGTEVSSTVAGRYGDSPMWQAMFVEGKLMHAVCIWAFTGTWDFDIAALLEGNSTLPVTESIGMMYPCERRFMSFNPTTTPDGLVTWSYHFGFALIPGADLTYNLNLICSAGVDCKETDGFDQGRCDCRAGEEIRPVTHPELTGQLGRAGTLDKEIWHKIDNTGLRYDKAVLEWKWTGNDGQLHTDSVECVVNQIGGNAPAFCSFDIGHGVFRCSLGFDQQNWAQLNRVEAVYPAGQEAYKLGDKIELLVDVQQGIPSNPDCTSLDCEYTKYITGKIYNPAKGVVWESVEAKRINSAGQTIMTDFPSESSTLFQISRIINEEAFTSLMTRAPTGAVQTCISGMYAFLRVDKCYPGGSSSACGALCHGFGGLRIIGKPNEKKQYVFASNQTHFKVFIPESVITKGVTSIILRQGVTQQEASLTNTFYKPAAVQPPQLQATQLQKIEGTGSVVDIGNGLKVLPIGNPDVRHLEILFYVNPELDVFAGADICSQFNTLEKAKSKNPWRAEYKMWSAKQIGTRYEKSNNLEIYRGDEQIGESKFYFVCSDTIEVKPGVTPEGLLVGACPPRTITQLTSPCWCNETTIAEIKKGERSRAEFPYDCGPGNTVNKEKNYCVDGYCGNRPACNKDPHIRNDNTCICRDNQECPANWVCDYDGEYAQANSKWQYTGEDKERFPGFVGSCLEDPICVARQQITDKRGCYCANLATKKIVEVCKIEQFCCHSGECASTAEECGLPLPILTLVGVFRAGRKMYPRSDGTYSLAKSDVPYNLKLTGSNSGRKFVVKKAVVLEGEKTIKTLDCEGKTFEGSEEPTEFECKLGDITDDMVEKEFEIRIEIRDVEMDSLINEEFSVAFSVFSVVPEDTYDIWREDGRYIATFSGALDLIPTKLKIGPGGEALDVLEKAESVKSGVTREQIEEIDDYASVLPKLENALSGVEPDLVSNIDAIRDVGDFYVEFEDTEQKASMKITYKRYTIAQIQDYSSYNFFIPLVYSDIVGIVDTFSSIGLGLDYQYEELVSKYEELFISVPVRITGDKFEDKFEVSYEWSEPRAVKEPEKAPPPEVIPAVGLLVIYDWGEEEGSTSGVTNYELTFEDVNNIKVEQVIGQTKDNKLRFYKGSVPIKGVPTKVRFRVNRFYHTAGDEYVSIATDTTTSLKPLIDAWGFAPIEIENTGAVVDENLKHAWLDWCSSTVDLETGDPVYVGSALKQFRDAERRITNIEDHGGLLFAGDRNMFDADGTYNKKSYVDPSAFRKRFWGAYTETRDSQTDISMPYDRVGSIKVDSFLVEGKEGRRFYLGRDYLGNPVVFRVDSISPGPPIGIAPKSIDKPLWQMAFTEEFHWGIELDGYPGWHFGGDPELLGYKFIHFGSGGIKPGGFPGETLLEKFRNAEAGMEESKRLFPRLYNEIKTARQANNFKKSIVFPQRQFPEQTSHVTDTADYDLGVTDSQLQGYEIKNFVGQYKVGNNCGYRFYFGLAGNEPMVLRVNMCDVDAEVSISKHGVGRDGITVSLEYMVDNEQLEAFRNLDTPWWGNFEGHDLDDYGVTGGKNLLVRIQDVEGEDGVGFSQKCLLFNGATTGVKPGEDKTYDSDCWA